MRAQLDHAEDDKLEESLDIALEALRVISGEVMWTLDGEGLPRQYRDMSDRQVAVVALEKIKNIL